MKKKYILTTIIISITLIVAVITTNILTVKLLKRQNNALTYTISDIKISSINTVADKKLSLVSYEYLADSDGLYKIFVYNSKDNQALVNSYLELLLAHDNFNLISTNNLDSANGKYQVCRSDSESNSKLTLDLSYNDSKIEIVLKYYYI